MVREKRRKYSTTQAWHRSLLTPGKVINIPAGEYYEGSNPYDEPMVLLGNSHKPTAEDLAKIGGKRSEIDESTGKRIAYQHGGGRDTGKVIE